MHGCNTCLQTRTGLIWTPIWQISSSGAFSKMTIRSVADASDDERHDGRLTADDSGEFQVQRISSRIAWPQGLSSFRSQDGSGDQALVLSLPC